MIKKEYIDNLNNTVLDNMIKNNDIKELLDYKIIDKEIKYKTDGKLTLNETLTGVNDINKFLKVFKSIVNALINLESYMITQNYLYLNMEDIYLDIDENIYLQINTTMDRENNVKSLYQSIINRICFKSDVNSYKIIDINNYFNSSDYNLEELIYKLEKLINNNYKNELIEDINIHIDDNKKKIQEKNKKKKNFFNFKNLFKKKDKLVVENKLDKILKFSDKSK